MANDPAILGLGTRIATLYFSNSALLFSIASFPISNASRIAGIAPIFQPFLTLEFLPNFSSSPFFQPFASINLYSESLYFLIFLRSVQSLEKFQVRQLGDRGKNYFSHALIASYGIVTICTSIGLFVDA